MKEFMNQHGETVLAGTAAALVISSFAGMAFGGGFSAYSTYFFFLALWVRRQYEKNNTADWWNFRCRNLSDCGNLLFIKIKSFRN